VLNISSTTHIVLSLVSCQRGKEHINFIVKKYDLDQNSGGAHFDKQSVALSPILFSLLRVPLLLILLCTFHTPLTESTCCTRPDKKHVNGGIFIIYYNTLFSSTIHHHLQILELRGNSNSRSKRINSARNTGRNSHKSARY